MIILFTQYHNYQPVKKLVDIIPSSIKADDTNEFKQLELYHGEMSRRNLFMQNKLEHISRNVRELYFYSKLKGDQLPYPGKGYYQYPESGFFREKLSDCLALRRYPQLFRK